MVQSATQDYFQLLRRALAYALGKKKEFFKIFFAYFRVILVFSSNLSNFKGIPKLKIYFSPWTNKYILRLTVLKISSFCFGSSSPVHPIWNFWWMTQQQQYEDKLDF